MPDGSAATETNPARPLKNLRRTQPSGCPMSRFFCETWDPADDSLKPASSLRIVILKERALCATEGPLHSQTLPTYAGNSLIDSYHRASVTRATREPCYSDARAQRDRRNLLCARQISYGIPPSRQERERIGHPAGTMMEKLRSVRKGGLYRWDCEKISRARYLREVREKL